MALFYHTKDEREMNTTHKKLFLLNNLPYYESNLLSSLLSSLEIRFHHFTISTIQSLHLYIETEIDDVGETWDKQYQEE